ncbi:MAG: flagellar basal body protein [Phycisphaerae bacterium]
MISALNTAIGGMRRNQRGAETVAQNIANLNTDGYRARRYDAASDRRVNRRPDDHTPATTSFDLTQHSDVDLTTELVELKQFEIGYRANAAVVAVADRMAGDLLDMFG